MSIFLYCGPTGSSIWRALCVVIHTDMRLSKSGSGSVEFACVLDNGLETGEQFGAMLLW